MSAKQRRRLRQRLFEHGAREFGTLFPQYAGYYLCPLCTNLAANRENFDDLFSLEDVPPEAVGGKPLVLTCAECNKQAGHAIDAHLDMEHRVRDVAKLATRKGFRAKMTARGAAGELNVELEITDGTFRLAGLEGEHSPGALEAERLLVQAEGSTDWGLSLSFPIGNPRRAAVARLKAAYLGAFAAFGYRYILGDGLQIVRKQIAEPDEKLFPAFEGTLPLPHPSGLHLYAVAPPSAALIVQLDDIAVFLPLPAGDMGFYDALPGRFGGGQVTVRMREYLWPTTPEAALPTVRAADSYLTRKAKDTWPSAIVHKETDGSFTLERTGQTGLALGATFPIARKALKDLRSAARADEQG